jgi:hypothetical protein
MSIPNPFDPDTAIPEVPDLHPEPVNNSRNAGKNSAAEQGLEIPMGWKPTIAEPVPVVRCTATSTTTGERCKRWSIRGTTICQTHGGRLPNVVEHSQAVVESARLRLFGLAEEAVDAVADLVQQGTNDAIRLKAAEMILNRTGLKDAVEIQVEVKQSANLSEEINKRLAIMRERREAAEKEAEEAELIDEGEIVDEPEESDADEV